MLLFHFLMLEMDSVRIGFISNFKDDWTNPRIEVMFGLRFHFFKCCHVACCVLVGSCIEVPEIIYFQF